MTIIGIGDEEDKAMHCARRERVRNVLDNRGLSYDEETLSMLSDGGEEEVRRYLLENGVEVRSPLDDRSESGLSVGGLTDGSLTE